MSGFVKEEGRRDNSTVDDLSSNFICKLLILALFLLAHEG